MFRCEDSAGVSHRFSGLLPRHVGVGGVCEHCDNPVAAHQGPVLGPKYEFELQLAAQALVDVGAGLTYTQAALRARAMAGRGPYSGLEPAGGLIAEWIDVFAPALLAVHAQTSWPQTVLADGTNFFISNKSKGTSNLAFTVIGIYGYPEGGGRGHVLGLYACHDETGQNYADAFTYVERLGDTHTGQRSRWEAPAMVLTDGAGEVLGGVRAFWNAGIADDCGPGQPRPFAKRCEWHMRRNADRTLAAHGIGGPRHWLKARLDTAFLREEGWDEFNTRGAEFAAVATWCRKNDAQVRAQAARRAQLPAHHSLAALDQVITRVRDRLEKRAGTFRNQNRLNLLLGLMYLRELGLDNANHYHVVLRDAVTAASGQLNRQRASYCTHHAYDLRP